MFLYFLVFEYTKNGNSYKINKTILLDNEFSVDDWETQEKITSDENQRKCRLTFFSPIAPSQSQVFRPY